MAQLSCVQPSPHRRWVPNSTAFPGCDPLELGLLGVEAGVDPPLKATLAGGGLSSRLEVWGLCLEVWGLCPGAPPGM